MTQTSLNVYVIDERDSNLAKHELSTATLHCLAIDYGRLVSEHMAREMET